MARAQGLSEATVRRIWRQHGLKSHLVKTFKVSTDPDFTDKLVDVVGLYMNPPDKAAVFSFDEKSQIQALDRTQPGLPMKKGRLGPEPTTTSATERPPSSPRSACLTAR